MKKVSLGKKLFSMVNALAHGVRPKKYYCRFMAPGLTNYPGEDGKTQEMWFMPREVMDTMQEGFIGCPVVIEKDHNGGSTPDNFTQVAVGVISDVETREDGWDWAGFIVWDDDTQQKIDRSGWNVSCAYNTIDFIDGGVLNAINYDHEIKQAEYIHLAIVPQPRQTGARILLNSIDSENDGGILFAMNGKEYRLYPKGKTKLNASDDVRAYLEAAIANKLPMSKIVADLKEKGLSESQVQDEIGKLHKDMFANAADDVKEAWKKFNALGWADERIKSKLKNLKDARDAASASGEDKSVIERLQREIDQLEQQSKKNEGGNNMTEEEKKAAEEKARKEEESKRNEGKEIDIETASIETPEGPVLLKDMLSCYDEAKKSAAPKGLTLESEYKGVKVSEAYEAFKAKKSALSDEEKKKAEEEAAKKNADDEAKKKADEAEAKKNARRNALKEEGKSDEEIESTLKSEAESEAEAEAKKNAEDAEAKKKAEEEKVNHLNTLRNARDKGDGKVPELKPILTKGERAGIAKKSRQY